MLDKLPAWARHLLIIFGAAFGGLFFSAIVKAGGVLPFPWQATFVAAVNAGAVAVAGTVVLWCTSATRQYGVGASKAIGGDSDDTAD